jgi:Cytochrome c554 and c-prime
LFYFNIRDKIRMFSNVTIMSFTAAFAVWIALSAVMNGFSGAAPMPSDTEYKVAEQGRGFVGDDACKTCHRVQHLSYELTAHHQTSALPTTETMLGSFKTRENVIQTVPFGTEHGTPAVEYKMETKGGRYYETAITGIGARATTRTELIALIIGSGVRGQSYLYWHGDELYELPVSYWKEGNQWINSPGFGKGLPIFDRPASPRCLECHVTYMEALSPDPAENRYDKDSLVTGIGCEVCHGPGGRHVALHRGGGSSSSDAEAILNPAHFSRDRQVDMCALCHNGAQQTKTGAAFSYTPGDPLEEYLGSNPADEAIRPDVHANQVGLLKRSRCYLGSANMSCSTCHNVHMPERSAASYSTRCLTCHKVQSCAMEKKMGPGIANNCIDCHMPVLQTDAIVSETGGKTIRTSMRTHWIKIYPEAERQTVESNR